MFALLDQRIELFALFVAELHDVLLYRSLLRSHDASPSLRSHRFRDPHQNQRRGVLEFTSDPAEDLQNPRELRHITSKGAYIWAGVALFIARLSATLPKDERIDDIKINAAICYAVQQSLHTKESNSRSLPSFVRGRDLPIKQIPQPSLGSFAYYLYSVDQDVECSRVLYFLFAYLGINGFWNQEELNRSLQLGYEYAVDNDLIVDPIVEATLGIAILSLVPFSFVARTRKGQSVYRKIQAGLWRYERIRRKEGEVEVSITFETARIAKILKVGITAAYRAATREAGEEPEL